MRNRLLIIAAVCGLGVGLFWWLGGESTTSLLEQARIARADRDWVRLDRLARDVLEKDGSHHEANLLAGIAAASQGEPDEALRRFELIPDDSEFAIEARQTGAHVALVAMRLSVAEAQLQRLVALDPTNIQARQNLAYLLGLSSRWWDRSPHLLAQIRDSGFDHLQLRLLALGDSLVENPADLDRYRAASPDDPAVLLGVARQLIDSQQDAQAVERLHRVIDQRPDLIEAHVRLGRLALGSNPQKPESISRWHANLPESADEHPSIWEIRGHWARANRDVELAARCYWEAVHRNPNDQISCYQLGQTLRVLGRSSDAKPFLLRAKRLAEYVTAVTAADRDLQERGTMLTASHLAEELGLLWEAYGFAALADSSEQDLREEDDRRVRLRDRLEGLPLRRTLAAANPALNLDLSDYQLPDWSDLEIEWARESSPVAEDGGLVAFEEQAQQLGIDFQYVNGGTPQRKIEYMHELTGGGVGVLDYDSDGWPDLYLTQGGTWPPGEQNVHLDRLFANRSDSSFVDVTRASRLVENRFSQGLAVGDFNNDGFPDVLVANIGLNQLFENNGDGTFSNVTVQSGIDGDRWTTSCAIADLNQDGWPDIYTVNYLTGANLFSKPCVQGRCSPAYYEAAEDQLYLSLGDGRFSNITNLSKISESSGGEVPHGKGLGLVVADWNNSGRLDVLVANDTSPNFLLINQKPNKSGPSANGIPTFTEHGLGLGLATNGRGQAEGSMGIAVGDVNGDGRQDAFVTNFMDETNTLYVQAEDGSFEDRTEQHGLGGPSFRMLGFGTQFLDADLDGWPDLLIANGHVGNHLDEGVPYQMRPQFFRNVDGAHFVEARGDLLGEYFKGKFLGRGLAVLDWNRDGRQDAAITHLDAPAAVLTNRTKPQGRWLSVRLRATRSARDAIGTRVQITTADRRIVQQLTAGNGYHASNERTLVFGLGDVDAQRVQLSIRWPSGAEEHVAVEKLEAGILAVEGVGLYRTP